MRTGTRASSHFIKVKNRAFPPLSVPPSCPARPQKATQAKSSAQIVSVFILFLLPLHDYFDKVLTKKGKKNHGNAYLV
jgi:hypothetical protein